MRLILPLNLCGAIHLYQGQKLEKHKGDICYSNAQSGQHRHCMHITNQLK